MDFESDRESQGVLVELTEEQHDYMLNCRRRPGSEAE